MPLARLVRLSQPMGSPSVSVVLLVSIRMQSVWLIVYLVRLVPSRRPTELKCVRAVQLEPISPKPDSSIVPIVQLVIIPREREILNVLLLLQVISSIRQAVLIPRLARQAVSNPPWDSLHAVLVRLVISCRL